MVHYIYTFSGALAPDRILLGAKFSIRPSLAFDWQRYCTALQQRASAKLCGVVQGMKSRNFRRGRHLYSTGRPSRWALAHILVMAAVRSRCGHYIFALWFLLSSIFYLLSVTFFLRLFSAVADWVSTILPHNGVALVRI